MIMQFILIFCISSSAYCIDSGLHTIPEENNLDYEKVITAYQNNDENKFLKLCSFLDAVQAKNNVSLLFSFHGAIPKKCKKTVNADRMLYTGISKIRDIDPANLEKVLSFVDLWTNGDRKKIIQFLAQYFDETTSDKLIIDLCLGSQIKNKSFEDQSECIRELIKSKRLMLPFFERCVCIVDVIMHSLSTHTQDLKNIVCGIISKKLLDGYSTLDPQERLENLLILFNSGMSEVTINECFASTNTLIKKTFEGDSEIAKNIFTVTSY